MNTLIINLPFSVARREYMEWQLAPYKDVLSLTFVEAVDGRRMSDDDISTSFDQSLAFRRYGRFLKKTEVGCTLSHIKCCNILLQSEYNCVLVCEDDMVLEYDLRETISVISDYITNTDRPMIVLLSGDYWWTKLIDMNGIKLAIVREAVCAHAYFINRSAAQILSSVNPGHLADDWYLIRKLGIKVLAVYPHAADQNRADFDTEISNDYLGTIRLNLRLDRRIHSYYRAVVKRFMAYMGHFESKSFKMKK